MPKAQLIAVAGPNAGTIFDISGSITVGTSPACDVRVDDPSAGEEHLRILLRDGAALFEPLAGNVVLVNDAPPRKGKLQHGDVLAFGATRLVFADKANRTMNGTDSMVVRKSFDSSLDSIARSLARSRNPETRLRNLLELSRALHSPENLGQTLATVLDIVLRAFDGDRAAVLLVDRDTGALSPGAIRIYEDLPTTGDSFWSQTILEEVLTTGESILTQDTQVDRRFRATESVVAHSIVSSMSALLPGDQQPLGVLYVDTFQRRGAFSEDDLEMFDAMAQQAAMVVENARLYRELERKVRLDQELKVASKIQQRVFPAEPPVLEAIDLFGMCLPAQEVGGDYFDFLLSDSGALYVAVGDVSGKGITAGLIMMMSRSLFRPLARKDRPPREIIEEMNRDLVNDTRVETFFTFAVMRWTPGARTVQLARAGHEALWAFRVGQEGPEKYQPSGPALGIVEDIAEKVEEIDVPINEGDVLFLFSDGATDAFDSRRETFGVNRLLESAGSRLTFGARSLVEGTMQDILDYARGADQHDDITLVAMRLAPPAEGSEGGPP